MTHTVHLAGGPMDGNTVEVAYPGPKLYFPKARPLTVTEIEESPEPIPVQIDTHVYNRDYRIGSSYWMYAYEGVRSVDKEDPKGELKWAPGLYYVDYSEDPDNPTFHYLSSPLWEGQLENELQLEVLSAHLQYAVRKLTKIQMGGNANG